MPAAILHDKTRIPLIIAGEGPTLLLAVGLDRATGELERQMKAEGLDPQLGLTLLQSLMQHFTVVAFNYEDHRIRNPAPGTLTPNQVTEDLLAIADAAGAETFAYYGYSWLGLAGIHLAASKTRVRALAIGGFPPLGAPFEALYDIAVQAHRAAVGRTHSTNPASITAFTRSSANMRPTSEELEPLLPMRAAQARQFVTFFRHLKETDETATLLNIRCPAMCFIGSNDTLPGPDGTISMAAPLLIRRNELVQAGWNVQVLEGLDQIEAMQPSLILKLVLPWLQKQAITSEKGTAGCGEATRSNPPAPGAHE